MEHKHWPNLASLFFTRAGEMGDKPFLWHKVEPDWQSTSWAVAASRCAAITRALGELGIAEGDRVALVERPLPTKTSPSPPFVPGALMENSRCAKATQLPVSDQ